jgi:hypothetical protein
MRKDLFRVLMMKRSFGGPGGMFAQARSMAYTTWERKQGGVSTVHTRRGPVRRRDTHLLHHIIPSTSDHTIKQDKGGVRGWGISLGPGALQAHDVGVRSQELLDLPDTHWPHPLSPTLHLLQSCSITRYRVNTILRVLLHSRGAHSSSGGVEVRTSYCTMAAATSPSLESRKAARIRSSS